MPLVAIDRPSAHAGSSAVSPARALRLLPPAGYCWGSSARKSSGGPPGATVIGRGLQRVIVASQILEELLRAGKL